MKWQGRECVRKQSRLRPTIEGYFRAIGFRPLERRVVPTRIRPSRIAAFVAA